MKKDLQKELEHILLSEWDPIGLKNYIEAEREYAHYIPSICHMIITGAPKADTLQYISELETDHMGLPEDMPRIKALIDKLYSV